MDDNNKAKTLLTEEIIIKEDDIIVTGTVREYNMIHNNVMSVTGS